MNFLEQLHVIAFGSSNPHTHTSSYGSLMLMLCYLNYSGLSYRENSANGEDKLGFKCKIPYLKMRKTLRSLFDLLQSTGPASCMTGALPPPNISLVLFNCHLKISEAKHEET